MQQHVVVLLWNCPPTWRSEQHILSCSGLACLHECGLTTHGTEDSLSPSTWSGEGAANCLAPCHAALRCRVLTGVSLWTGLPIPQLHQLRRLGLVGGDDEEILRTKMLSGLEHLEELSARDYCGYDLCGLPPSLKRLHLHVRVWQGMAGWGCRAGLHGVAGVWLVSVDSWLKGSPPDPQTFWGSGLGLAVPRGPAGGQHQDYMWVVDAAAWVGVN
jgi:hypothetical protein